MLCGAYLLFNIKENTLTEKLRMLKGGILIYRYSGLAPGIMVIVTM